MHTFSIFLFYHSFPANTTAPGFKNSPFTKALQKPALDGHKKSLQNKNALERLVRVTGFEPAAS